MPQTVLIVDDEKRMVSLLKSYLEQEGYRVAAAHNGQEALEAARREKPDLVVLDIMMPEMNGYEFMRAHRKESDTPIIMLTAKVEDEDKIIGLELGADDYVTKPFKPRELMARIRNVLRRAGKNEAQGQTLKALDIILNRETREVNIGRRTVDLTPSEFDLLAALMTSPGKVFSRLDLLDVIQGVRYEGYERTIDTHVKNLRSKVEEDPKNPSYIETVYGIGYRLRKQAGR
ncbi:MAG: response regulator transcription factor [Anaerolineales bacterium]|nr:response regulator transcription factor [Anaerolineales bacterium]